MMNSQFIQGILFEWNKIDDDSYLKKIEAFKDIEELEFKNPIIFFVGRKYDCFSRTFRKWKVNIVGSDCSSIWI